MYIMYLNDVGVWLHKLYSISITSMFVLTQECDVVANAKGQQQKNSIKNILL